MPTGHRKTKTAENPSPGGDSLGSTAVLAVDDVNAGGVMGQTVTVNDLDDACDPEPAKAFANLAAIDGSVLAAGHWCSSSFIPAGEIYRKAGVLMITPASTSPKLIDERGSQIFRQSGRDDKQGVDADSFLAESWGEKKQRYSARWHRLWRGSGDGDP